MDKSAQLVQWEFSNIDFTLSEALYCLLDEYGYELIVIAEQRHHVYNNLRINRVEMIFELLDRV